MVRIGGRVISIVVMVLLLGGLHAMVSGGWENASPERLRSVRVGQNCPVGQQPEMCCLYGVYTSCKAQLICANPAPPCTSTATLLGFCSSLPSCTTSAGNKCALAIVLIHVDACSLLGGGMTMGCTPPAGGQLCAYNYTPAGPASPTSQPCNCNPSVPAGWICTTGQPASPCPTQ